MRSTLLRLFASTGGTAAVEFALIVPFMLLLAAGIVEFGMIIKVYNSANRLATQYAIAWSDCSDSPAGACQTELANYTSAATIGNIVPQLRSQNVTLQMFQVRMSSPTPPASPAPTVIYAYPSGAALSAAQTAAAQNILKHGQTGVVVTVTYRHSLSFFAGLMGHLLDSTPGTTLRPSYTVVQLKF